MTEPAILCTGLTRLHAPGCGVEDLDLRVERGEIFGFLGPNGAGKTTVLRLLLDLLRPERGRAEIFGVEARAGGAALRRRIGYLPSDLALFPRLSGRATLDLFAAIYERPPVLRDRVLDVLGFPASALDRPTRTYSSGLRQMIGVAVAFQHDPELLVLDEPTTGLDPIVRAAFLDLLREAKGRGRTVFFSNHVLDEVDRVADRVGLVARARLRRVATLDELRAAAPRTVVVRRREGGVETFEHAGAIGPLLARLAADPSVEDVRIEPASLEAVFRRAAGTDLS